MDSIEMSHYLHKLGQLAFYARIYRMWIKHPISSASGFISEFPDVKVPEEILEACHKDFKVIS